tara:strand:+ start:239 stop:415 length:177 start_codon:yes stop_codon:yes gene_type:complete
MNYKVVLRISDGYTIEDLPVALFHSSGSAIVSANALNSVNDFDNQEYIVLEIDEKKKK